MRVPNREPGQPALRIQKTCESGARRSSGVMPHHRHQCRYCGAHRAGSRRRRGRDHRFRNAGPDPHRHSRRRGMGLRPGAGRHAVVPDPRRGHDARNQPPLRRDGSVSDLWPLRELRTRFVGSCSRQTTSSIRSARPVPREARPSASKRQATRSAGSGEPCTFEITITNSGTSGFSGPVRIGDAIGVDGIGRLEGVPITEIVPPFGCSPEPTTLPMSCVANLTLGAGEVTRPPGDRGHPR